MGTGDDLIEKTKAWLMKEGYPLEYETASRFEEAGFQVFQGSYYQDPITGKPREQDVLTWLSSRKNDPLVRVSHVVECKWSADHPWIVFTGTSALHPKACIAQTISSELGSDFLEATCGDPDMQSLAMFDAPRRPGFGARRAMSKDDDRAFAALQSVVMGAKAEADRYDAKKQPPLVRVMDIVLPLIVIKGILLIATPDGKGGIDLQPSETARIHWSGSDVYALHATVDIVTVDALPSFVRKRYTEVVEVLNRMEGFRAATDYTQNRVHRRGTRR